MKPAAPVPRCGNDAYHVFTVGASRCSICGWCRGCREVSCRQHGQGPEVIVTTQDYRAYTFTVVGAGPFPLDMLRYDSALPLGEDDAAQIVASFTALHEETQREIVLRRFVPVGASPAPSHARWKSYGWRVVGWSVRP